MLDEGQLIMDYVFINGCTYLKKRSKLNRLMVHPILILTPCGRIQMLRYILIIINSINIIRLFKNYNTGSE